MTITWTDVFSSDVSRVGYDTETVELLVEWERTKKISAYAGVPVDLAERVSKNWSVGTMLNTDIKPNYPHRYREE